mgnify:CR=1 FL=1
MTTTLLGSLKYCFYIIFHPFKGFWDMKHEKRGSLFAANILYVTFIIFNVISTQLSGPILVIQKNINVNNINVFLQISSIVLPILIWCVSNWAVTTLLEGEGTIKDIYMATAYALTPSIITCIPLIIMSNFFTVDEISSIYNFIMSVSIIWTAFLLFFGIMTIHQFTVTKNMGTFILSILGMAIIIAIALLFIYLISCVSNFVIAIFNEFSSRY